MTITISNTTKIVMCKTESPDGVECRLWEGVSDRGVKVQCLIVRIAAPVVENLAEFEAELQEQRAPSAEAQAFSMRMVL